MKPDWNKAPSWAEWWAVDPDGQAAWSEYKPALSDPRDGDQGWIHEGRSLRDGSACPHWKETLQSRPQKLEIRVGGWYRTRSGEKAWVLEEVASGVLWKGVVSAEAGYYSTACWGERGSYDPSRESDLGHDLDLIAEWAEESCK